MRRTEQVIVSVNDLHKDFIVRIREIAGIYKACFENARNPDGKDQLLKLVAQVYDDVEIEGNVEVAMIPTQQQANNN